jgi:hypothetical protein
VFGDICFGNNWIICHGHVIFIEPESERLILKSIQVVDRYGLFGALGFQPHRKY